MMAGNLRSVSTPTNDANNLNNTSSLKLRLVDFIANKKSKLTTSNLIVSGCTNSLIKSLLIEQFPAEKPLLIILSSEKEANQLKELIGFYAKDLNTYLLPKYDVSPFSGLYPQSQISSKRIGWASAAQRAKKGDIFIAPIEALLTKTMPADILMDHSFEFKVGQDLPAHFDKQLSDLGYSLTPSVEDIGTYAKRGGIIDIFSTAHSLPLRIELFGDEIESIRSFDPITQRSKESLKKFTLIPAKEIIYDENHYEKAIASFRKLKSVTDPIDYDETLRNLIQKNYFYGLEFLGHHFYKDNDRSFLSHFLSKPQMLIVNTEQITQLYDSFLESINNDSQNAEKLIYQQEPNDYLLPLESALGGHGHIQFEKIYVQNQIDEDADNEISYPAYSMDSFKKQCQEKSQSSEQLQAYVYEKLSAWKEAAYNIFITCTTTAQAERTKLLINESGLEAEIISELDWFQLREQQNNNIKKVHLFIGPKVDSLRSEIEKIIYLNDEDFFGVRRVGRKKSDSSTFLASQKITNIGTLKPDDLIIHKLHGVGIYNGLKKINLNDIEQELITISYKGGDKLYLPVYRIHQVSKFSGPNPNKLLDKLGGTGWNKTTAKVKKHLRDIAAELLKLYAERSKATKTPFSEPNKDFMQFESSFPFSETNDQLKAINDVIGDMTSNKPMDRLICGDVGFGKTEVAMRAAFKAAQDGKQVAIIAPTTLLAYQHYESFKKRFKGWPLEIAGFNRLVNTKVIKEAKDKLKSGKLDIAIGTHRLLSKDIDFKDLGLLVIDEEQKFGVKHKEKIRQLKSSVDTLVLSATPIPRTLNMSLMGLRDLSLINTAPVDRLPTRTFVSRYDNETIKKAILNERKRGGQAFFLSNRVVGIEAIAAELKELVPEARFAVAHGQMDEKQLEEIVVKFYAKEIDVLVCTTIIESGIDIPNANTIFIHNAQQLGLSQLYQLRGRVGRSKERAYCYLMIPKNKKLDKVAQERLKVIQENTALGSGITIAQHDLELRGAGNMLGEDQSGHVNSIGYEMYIDLLESTLKELKGEEVIEGIEPDLNIKIPALIPDDYMPDVRLRLTYYKIFGDIETISDLEKQEEALRDQFGAPPEAVLNLMGLMLIRSQCKLLGVKDISSGKDIIRLSFTGQTKVDPQKMIELTLKPNKKYTITPDSKLRIRIKEISWPRVYEEMKLLINYVGL